MKLKKFLSIFMVCVMGAGAFAACGKDNSDGAQNNGSDPEQTVVERQELQLLQGDYQIPPEDRLARIKAEYLIENQGYRDSDEVVAILSLNGDALIDSYLGDEELSAKDSLSEYAASPMGQQKREGIASEQTALIRRLQSEGLIKGVNYRYTTIANAVAVTMTYGSFLALEDLGYCKNVALAETYARPLETEGTDASTIVNDVDVYEDTGIFNSSSALDPNGNPYTGKGTSVAILDSGFDLSHQVFNTHTLDNEDELMFTRTDIADKLADSDMNAEKTTEGLAITDVFYSNKIPYKYDYADRDPDVFPFDSEHGTHVAGIIGGYANEFTDKDKNTVLDENGEKEIFTGIAIDTQLVLMKVFSDFDEGADTDDILAALEDAVLLGVDAINMSLGASCGFSREKDGDVVNDVYDKINESGTSLITAAGNEYSSGFGGAQGNTNFVTNPDSGTIGSPASYPAALSVASISGVKSKYLVGNNEQVVFFNESNSIAGVENDFFAELYEDMGWAKDNTPHSIEYVTIPGYGSRANYTTVNVKGKIALVSRGDTTFEEKALQAKIAGAAACIIYNNIEGDILMSMGKSDHIPTVSISKEDGVRLASQRSGTLSFSYSQQAGPFMSDFSCWGPLPDLTLKPEITAHGGNITSSAPGGGFITISGTSMACPNLCGVVVLIRQYIKDNYEDLTGNKTPEAGDDSEYMKNIKNLTNTLLMSTAGIVLNEQGNPYSPRKQGAGLASLYNAVNTKAYIVAEKKVNGELTAVDRPKLELGDDATRTGVYEMYLDVVSISDSPVEYDVGVIGMTESVSTADEKFVAERDQLLNGSVKVEVASGSESGAGSVNGTFVTVNPKKTLKLKVTYTLSQADKDLIDNAFPYGMYVEGFVTLKNKAEAAGDEKPVDLNVPFLAYYGDWTQAPIFDKTYYEVETEAHNAGIDEEDKIKADYYATTPYGSYWYNYIIPLGTYIYDMDESSYDPIPATEDRIAISDTLNTIDGIAAVYSGLLRGCKTMTYTIVDRATGELIYTKEVVNAHKAFSQGGSPIPNYQGLNISTAELGLLNNHQYDFKMVGALDYGDGGASTNARNSFSFTFTVDTQSPIIKSAVYEKVYDKTLKKDRYYLDLTIYDNTYAMSVTPGIMTRNPEYNGNYNETSPVHFTELTANAIPLYGDKGGDAKVRIEITDYLPEIKNSIYINAQTGSSWYLSNCLAISLDDYALNQNLFLCTLPGTSGDLAFTKDGTAEGEEMRTVYVGIDEIKDLTQYLYTSDPTVDANKDYLKYLTWESGNESIAVVENGQVRGLKAGTARITVSDPVSVRSAQITVVVTKKNTDAAPTALSEVSEDKGISLLTADDVQDATQAKITDIRFSNFETIFAHASAGQVSDIGSTGETTVLTAYPGGISMYPGEIIRLNYAVTPWYAEGNYTYTYRSDREDVLTVDEDGVVRALKKGSATVTLTVSGSNLRARLRITVNSEFVIDEARTLVAYKGLGGYVEIPDDEGIMYIGPYCFSLYETNNRYAQELPEDDIYANRIPMTNSTITDVVIPDGVSEIQQNAFAGCTGLKSVVLPDTLKFIRKNAFTGDTKLETINLKDVEAIAADAFAGCSALQEVDLSKCYSVGERAFKGTGLRTLDVKHIRNAGKEAFMNCKSLTSVEFDENGLTKLSEHIFDGCALTSIQCSEKNVIPAYAFANNKLQSVTLTSQEGIALIGDNAFANNPDLEELTLPNGAFSLGNNVFDGCTKLATVKLQEKTKITSAQGAVFSGSGLMGFALAEGTTNALYTIGDNGKQLLSGNEIVLAAVKAYDGALTVPATVTGIRESAFAGAGITELTIEGDAAIGQYAFANCSALTKVTLAGSGNVRIGNYAFYGCAALGSVENLNKATVIGDQAFASAKALTDATLGANVTVGESAFEGSGLKSLTLGEGDKLGAFAFYDCTALTTVNMPEGGKVQIGTACFSGDARLETIDLAKAAGELGEEAFFGCSLITAADLTNITKIGALAFANCKKLATVTLGEDTAEIGMGAFMDYNYFTRGSGTQTGPCFTSIDLSHVTSIGECAFFRCAQLASVELPAGVTGLADNTFAYCTSLGTVDLKDVTSIGNFAFIGCTNLSSVDLSRVTTIGAGAFYRTTKLTNANLAAAERVESLAFADSGLTTVNAPVLKELPTTVLDRNVVLLSASEINLSEVWIDIPDIRQDAENDLGDYVFTGSYAFRNNKFESFDAPQLSVIGEGAFRGNKALTSFKFYNTLTSVRSGAFYGCTALASFTTDGENGKINDYAHLTDGVLYTVLQNGKQQLSAVPSAREFEGGKLTVEEGTSRVDDYAGNANTAVTSLVLPDSLETIGEYAFYGYTALTSVEFRSVTAPALDDSYDENASLSETDPGYQILHDQFSMYGDELCYYNFIDLVGKRAPISVILPKNSDIAGYDSILYRAYFGEVADATRSDYTAMEQSMKDFLWYGKQVKAIENIMLTDEALISKAVVALNGVKQDPTAYGVTKAEWDELSAAVTSARDRITRLKIEYASKTVRDIQARIDALPDSYSDTQELNSEILALQEAIGNLQTDDRGLLVQTKYTELLEAYNAAHPDGPEDPGPDDPGPDDPGPDDPGPGKDPEGPGTGDEPNPPEGSGENPPSENPGDGSGEADNGCGSVIGIGGGVIALAILLGAAIILLKKKEN